MKMSSRLQMRKNSSAALQTLTRVIWTQFYFLLILISCKNDLFGHCIALDDISDADKPIPIVDVEGVLGNRVKLPCNVGEPKTTRDDKLHMVLWFKERASAEQPIYRYDVRDKPDPDAKRWSDWGDRVYFQAFSQPAHLSIQDLRNEDEGVYRCRVDFKNSPTRNIRINLTIIVPPNKPVILESNKVVESAFIGPYNEGSDLILTCEVSGGRPKPRVSWWLENAMIDESWSDRGDGTLVNKLVYQKLYRHHLNAKFICQASNTNQTIPQSTMVMLNLNHAQHNDRAELNAEQVGFEEDALNDETTAMDVTHLYPPPSTIDNVRPLIASILIKDTNLLAERRYDVECISSGSRPPATITWWKNGRQIKKMPNTPHSEDKNVSRSILNFTPSIDDDGKVLTCRSENPAILASAVEDRWVLNVQYAPRVSLQLGSNLVADDIKEGDDVYFECSVKANPSSIRLSWFHEGRELRHNASQRVIMSNTRLVLQKITRHHAGNYTCTALNAEGSSQSNVVALRVKYVPTCKSNTEELIGAMRHETVTVMCEMASDPPSVQFHWTFNNSGVEVMHVPQSRYTSKGTLSWLNYTPVTEMDYGTLACWGSNKIGKGFEGPCLFQIVSAGRPFPPKNCSVFNQTADSLNLVCMEGFNGGLPQHFVLEVVDYHAKKIKLNASSKMPVFSVEGMEPGVLFHFNIYAVNSKGRSDPFHLDGITFRGAAELRAGTPSPGEMNPLFAILVGCTVVLIIFLAVTIIAIWKRSRRKKPPVVRAFKRDNENTFQSAEDTLTKIDQNSLEDIGNPDVIPNKNERSGGLRGFIRIHKTPPARRRKKDLEVKNNGETVALALAESQEEPQRNHNHKILSSSAHHNAAPRESRI